MRLRKNPSGSRVASTGVVEVLVVVSVAEIVVAGTGLGLLGLHAEARRPKARRRRNVRRIGG